MLKIELELISDIDMHLFIEKRMRGGISYISKRHSKAFNGFCLNFIEENSSAGYILEVDIEYPGELHELHNDYPLGPEKHVVKICCQNIAVLLQMNMV